MNVTSRLYIKNCFNFLVKCVADQLMASLLLQKRFDYKKEKNL